MSGCRVLWPRFRGHARIIAFPNAHGKRGHGNELGMPDISEFFGVGDQIAIFPQLMPAYLHFFAYGNLNFLGTKLRYFHFGNR
jgi:hypothetical protein